MGCWSGHTCDTTGAVYILHSTLVFCMLMASKLCVINLCEQVVVVHINSSSSQSLCVVLEACVWFRAASLGHIRGHIRGRMCGRICGHLFAAFADILALQNTMLRGLFSGWLEIQRLLLLWQIWREDVVLSGVYS